MSHLPNGWAEVSLADVADVIRGVTYDKTQASNSRRDGYLPILRATNINGGLDLDSEMVFVPAKCVKPAQRMVQGDIVVASSSGSASVVGKSAQLRNPWEGGFGAFCSVIRASNGLNASYLAHFVAGPRVRKEWRGLAQGTNINNLRTSHLAETIVPIAPRAEQERIVAAIEEKFSRLDAGVLALERARRNLKRLRASVLASLIKGALVRQQDEAPASTLLDEFGIQAQPVAGLPRGWASVRLGDLAETRSGGTPSRSSAANFGGSIPWVKSGELREGTIRSTEELITGVGLASSSAKVLPRGALLLALYGATVGRVAILDLDGATTNQAICAILPRIPGLEPFLFYWLMASRDELIRLGQGGAQPNISQTIVRDLAIPLPPLDEQRRAVVAAETWLSAIGELEASLAVEAARAKALRSSILSEAFSGRLVPQDLTDEPASVLLEHLATEGASSNRVTRPHLGKPRSPRTRVTA